MHPPVGVLLNHLLTVFNELRQCMPYELRPQVSSLDCSWGVLLVGMIRRLFDTVVTSVTAIVHV